MGQRVNGPEFVRYPIEEPMSRALIFLPALSPRERVTQSFFAVSS